MQGQGMYGRTGGAKDFQWEKPYGKSFEEIDTRVAELTGFDHVYYNTKEHVVE